MATRNNDIHYINKKLTEAFDALGGNTKEYRIYVKDVLGVNITQFETHKSKHKNETASGQLKLIRNNASNNKKASAIRDIANVIRAENKANKNILQDYKESRMISDMLADMMDELYEFITTEDRPQEMENQLYDDIQNLFFTKGKPDTDEIERVYAKYQEFMTGKTPSKFNTTDVNDETKIPDTP